MSLHIDHTDHLTDSKSLKSLLSIGPPIISSQMIGDTAFRPFFISRAFLLEERKQILALSELELRVFFAMHGLDSFNELAYM